MNTKYFYKKKVNFPFAEAVKQVKDELKKEEFGVLTQIDIKMTLKKKLDVDFDNYIILGACNPPNAHKALLEERDIGLMLPCNIIVYELNGKTFVSTVLPTVSMGMIKNKNLAKVAEQVEIKLKKVIDAMISE